MPLAEQQHCGKQICFALHPFIAFLQQQRIDIAMQNRMPKLDVRTRHDGGKAADGQLNK